MEAGVSLPLEVVLLGDDIRLSVVPGVDLRSSVVSVPCTRELVCSSYFPRNGDSKHPVSGRQVRLPKSWVTDLESLDLMGYARTGVAVANIGLIACSDAVKGAVIDGYGTAVSNIGLKADSGLSISDLLGYAPLSSVTSRSDNGFHPEVSILGLDDGDFALIRILSGSGKGFSGKGNSASLCSVLGHSQPIRFRASLRILGFGPFVENAAGSSSILSSDPTRSRLNRSDGGIGPVFEGVAINNVGTGSSNVQFASPIVESEDFREVVPVASVRLRTSIVGVKTDAAVSLVFDLSDLGFSDSFSGSSGWSYLSEFQMEIGDGAKMPFPRVSDLCDKRITFDPHGSFQANLSEENSGVKKMMPKTGVLDPVFNSLPSPETGSMDLYLAGSAGSCVSGSRGPGVGLHRSRGSCSGGVVPNIWDPFLLKTNLVGIEHYARAIAASSDAGVDPVEVGNDDRFRNGKAPASVTKGKGDKAVLSADSTSQCCCRRMGLRLGIFLSVNGYLGMATVAQLNSVIKQSVKHGLDAQISRSTNYHFVSTGQ